jgi:HPt (histidine-containing phosphotransfer) domain-containing protein
MIDPGSAPKAPRGIQDTLGACPMSQGRLRHAHREHRRKMLADFENRCKTEIRMLHDAYEREDLCTFMEVAYSIAGASRTVGVTCLAVACDAIEQAGRLQLALTDAGIATGDALGLLTREAYRFFQSELISLRQCLRVEASTPGTPPP